MTYNQWFVGFCISFILIITFLFWATPKDKGRKVNKEDLILIIPSLVLSIIWPAFAVVVVCGVIVGVVCGVFNLIFK